MQRGSGEPAAAVTGQRRAAIFGGRASRTDTPARFAPAFVVQALHVVDVDDALSWVRQVSLDPYARTEVSPGPVAMVTEHAGGSHRQTAIQPGEMLVQQPGSRFGWDAYTDSAFHAAYTRQPRELPVFDDGEVA